MTFTDTDAQRRILLLGPQNEYSSLRLALTQASLTDEATVGVISAGWEEDELDCAQLYDAIDRPVVNLELFRRSEDLFQTDQELIDGLRSRQDELRELRNVYRMRLDRLLEAARIMMSDEYEEQLFLPEQEAAIDQLRQLDRQYLVRTAQICDRYDQELVIEKREQVVAHRHELTELIANFSALVITGGHTAIIMNRLRMFGILEISNDLPIIAWSGGAMALSDQVVLFHDSPPQGLGNPEILRSGMQLVHDFVALPDAGKRLNLADRARVGLFSRRFRPYTCVLLENDTILDRIEGRWQFSNGTRQLFDDGSVAEIAG